MIARRLVIRGRVQGVGYRDWLARRVQGLGLVGWVRNCPDGSVEAWLQGEEAAVAAVTDDCRHGPPHAAVTAVEQQEVEETTLIRFAVVRDAPPGAG